MNELTWYCRLVLGGGWWTLWYGFFYLVVLTGNFIWFNELFNWTLEGKGGPAGEAVLLVTLGMGGIPVLLFSVVHLLLAGWRGADSGRFMMVFGLVLVTLILFWMIAGSLSIAGAVFAGFVAYYFSLMIFIFVNLALLWVIRRKGSLKEMVLLVGKASGSSLT